MSPGASRWRSAAAAALAISNPGVLLLAVKGEGFLLFIASLLLWRALFQFAAHAEYRRTIFLAVAAAAGVAVAPLALAFSAPALGYGLVRQGWAAPARLLGRACVLFAPIAFLGLSMLYLAWLNETPMRIDLETHSFPPISALIFLAAAPAPLFALFSRQSHERRAGAAFIAVFAAGAALSPAAALTGLSLLPVAAAAAIAWTGRGAKGDLAGLAASSMVGACLAVLHFGGGFADFDLPVFSADIADRPAGT